MQSLDVEFRSLMGELAALQPANGHARGKSADAAQVCDLVNRHNFWPVMPWWLERLAREERISGTQLRSSVLVAGLPGT